MDNQMFFLHFLLYGMIAVNGMSVGQKNAHLSTNAWNDDILAWLEQHQLHINVDNNLEVQTSYSRCSGDPHGFVGNKNNNHDVLCFDVYGDDGMTYRLYEKSNVLEEIGCERTELQITCDGPQEEIQIISATYGRTDDIECPGGPIHTTDCALNNAKEIVSDHCDGSPQCQFMVSNNFFQSDPCPGTAKYSLVKYMCVSTHVSLPKEFTVLASFKSMFPGSDDVIINEIQFCLNYITSTITIDFSKLSLDENGMENEWSWGLPGVYYTTNGLIIQNTSGYMFIIILQLPSGDYTFEIMRPGIIPGDYYLSIKAYANDLGGLMGQVHDYNIYSNIPSNIGDYGVGEINGNNKYFAVQKRPRGNIQCWYYTNQGDMVNAIYGDIAQYLQPTC